MILSSRRYAWLLAPAFACLLAACSSTPSKGKSERPVNPFKTPSSLSSAKPTVSEDKLKLEAVELYRRARSVLESGDYADALLRYETVVQRYPFTEYATQAEVERIYALHKSYKPDEALTAADRFLREHPRYPHADYVQYLKGVVSAERDQGLLESLPGVDPTKGDMSSQRRAFDDLALLIQKYPSSPYRSDARARMVDLRNRLAEHDLHVVRYYMKRKAFLAAAKRAEAVLALYPGAPASTEALQDLEVSYRTLGLEAQAQDAHALLLDQISSPVMDGPSPVGGSAALPPRAVGPKLSLSLANDSAASPPAEKGAVASFFSRIANLFSFAEQKQPVEIVLPSSSPAPTTAEAKAAAAAAPAAEKKSRLIVEIDADEAAASPKAGK